MKHKMDNRIAKLIWMFAWMAYIIAFFMSLSAGSFNGFDSYGFPYSQPFNWFASFSVWMTGFNSETLLLGFAEIIELLQKLVDQERTHEETSGTPTTLSQSESPEIAQTVRSSLRFFL